MNIDSKTMIFFDIDGTLLDHKGAELNGIKMFYKNNSFEKSCDFEVFKTIWLKYSDKNFEKFLKKEYTFEQQRAMRIIEVYKEFGSDISYEEALNKFQYYLEAYEESWEAYDDVFPCLEQLKDYRLGIISNGDYNQQIQKLKKMRIDTYFDDIVAAGDVCVAKPDVKIFEIACERSNVDKRNCYYIGDNIKTDIIPCKSIGLQAILINRDETATVDENIKRIFSLSDIKKCIESI